MDIGSMVFVHKAKIILAGFGVGSLHVMGFLPDTTDFLGAGSNIKFVYLGIMLFGAYQFNKYYKEKPAIQYQSKVPMRNLHNPTYHDDYLRSGQTPQKKQMSNVQKDELWDKFNK